MFYSSQVKDQTGLTISPSFIDHHLHHQPGTFSYEIKITVEREMMEKIRKLKMFHKSVKDSSWSLVVRRIKWGELKTLHLVFDDTDWRLVVRRETDWPPAERKRPVSELLLEVFRQ